MNENLLVDLLLQENCKDAIKKLGYNRSMEVIENLTNPVLRAKLRLNLIKIWSRIEG
jgi:hypothetical protein